MRGEIYIARKGSGGYVLVWESGKMGSGAWRLLGEFMDTWRDLMLGKGGRRGVRIGAEIQGREDRIWW